VANPVDLAKLKSTLATSGISQKNQPLHQILWTLIDFCQKNFQSQAADIATSSSGGGSGGGGSSTLVGGNHPLELYEEQFDSSFPMPGPMGPRGFTGLAGPPGLDGDDGIDGIDGFPGCCDPTLIASVTSTGTVNDLAIGRARYVYLDNATDVTITGIAGGKDGDIVTFISRGAGHAFFTPQDAGSAAGNRLINWVTVGFTPICAAVGTVTYAYDGSVSRWKIQRHNQGDFISIPFASCTYDSNTGAFWTVTAPDVISQKYYLLGKTMFVHVTINPSVTLAGVGTRLRINFSAYATWSWLNTTRNYARVVDAAAAQAGMITLAAATNLIQFSHDTADTAWAVGAGRVIDGATVMGMLT
jgi:hypothetical protein